MSCHIENQVNCKLWYQKLIYSMNKIEKIVYDLVKKNPWMKFLLRNLYQTFFDLLPQKKEHFTYSYDYKENCFFGFHDLDPFSFDNTKVLSNRTSIDLRMPKKNEELEIGYIDLDNGKLGDFNTLAHSKTWNYHKGCRLQWLTNKTVIFNTEDNNNIVSRIIDIQSGIERQIGYPIDSICRKNNIASSFSYERLEYCMPGYGYMYKDDGYLNIFSPKETGLFIIDLENNHRKLLVSIDELATDLNNKKIETSYWHFVTHSEFSIDGKYISFLHRWVAKDIKKRWTRLIVYDLENNKWFALPTTGWGVSHYVWNKSNQILAYSSLDGIDSHVIFDIHQLSHKRIVPEIINSDGHQSFIEEKVFITDTYPDKYRMAKIHKVNIETGNVELLASVYSPKEFQTKSYYSHIACDLHPRVSANGEYICFDSPRTGKRALYVMKINN